jgi:hypothetical protein
VFVGLGDRGRGPGHYEELPFGEVFFDLGKGVSYEITEFVLTTYDISADRLWKDTVVLDIDELDDGFVFDPVYGQVPGPVVQQLGDHSYIVDASTTFQRAHGWSFVASLDMFEG